MKRGRLTFIVVVAIAAGAGYWWGMQTTGDKTQERAPTQQEPERKVLYYRNPMGLPDTSPIPKKDPMGMDYVPVYEEDEAQHTDNAIKISVEKVQKLGVKTERAAVRLLDKTIRTVGRVEANERHIYSISPKFEGWIEKLYVNTTGAIVKKGQALFDVYSPDLVSAEREYTIAREGVASLKNADPNTRQSIQALAAASLTRLQNWDISEAQLKALAEAVTPTRTLTFHTPVDGVVLEKKAMQGMRFMPGEMLYQIADLSSVWVIADVFEQDIALLKTGSKASLQMNAYKDKTFEGPVTDVYPTLNTATRTVAVRLEIDNPRGLLKPGMFAEVAIPVASHPALSIPISAVMDSGVRQIVLIQLAEGRFLPRVVQLGRQSDHYVEVKSGIQEGEEVVVAANFLIDAESNLKAALSGLQTTDMGKETKPLPGNPHSGH
jgi:RND family efflux transporter MFP subunit